MSPASGRPPSENPKIHPFQMRLSEKDNKILEKCKKTFGFSKAKALLYGLELLDMANENFEFRQLFDALVVLKEIEASEELYQEEEYDRAIKRQLSQIQFNCQEFIKTYKK